LGELYFWLREPDYDGNAEFDFGKRIQLWLTQIWGFQKIALPGREITWSSWSNLTSNGYVGPQPGPKF